MLFPLFLATGGTVERACARVSPCLASPGEVQNCTSVMAVINQSTWYAVRDGYGRDWGNFGGAGYLVRMIPGNSVNLANYRYQQSIENVDIGFGKNRVSRVTLKAVRRFYTDGRVEVLAENQNLELENF